MKRHCVSAHVCIAFIALFIITGCSNSYTRWQSDVNLGSANFSKLRYSTDIKGDTTIIIGYIKTDTEIGGYPCRAGWVHLTKELKPQHFCLSVDHTINNLNLTSGTWVLLPIDNQTFTVVFPRDTLVNGYLCKGGGGMNGISTAFYSSGALRQFFPAEDPVVDGISCRGGLFHPVTLHENGKLKECTLGEDFISEGSKISKGTIIQVDTAGRITAK